MFTTDCKDPNCADCTDTSSAQSSEEGSESEILKTDAQNSAEFLSAVEDGIRKHMEASMEEKIKWILINRRLKDKVHSQIRALITILRLREEELYTKIDEKYNGEVFKIDKLILFGAIEKIKKINGAPPSETIPQFTSDFEDLKSRLGSFGQLSGIDVEQPVESLGWNAVTPQRWPALELATAAWSNLKNLEEDEVLAVHEKKIDLKESKEKTVEPEKCKEKIESKEKDTKKIEVCNKVSGGSIPVIKIRKRGRPTPILELRLPQKDLLKEGEVEVIFGAKEKRRLNEKTKDPKSSGKRSKKSVTQTEKKKKDAVEDRFQALQKQLTQLHDDIVLKKKGKPGRPDVLVKKIPDPFQCQMDMMNRSDLEDAVQPIDLGDISFETIRREPEKLSSQVRRRIDALKMKKPEEKLNAKVESDNEVLNKPEESEEELRSQQQLESEEELGSQRQLVRKHIKEIGQINEILKGINLAQSGEEYERRKEEAFRLFEGVNDGQIKKVCQFEESSEEDSSSDLDMEIISRNEAASIPADVSLSPPLPPKNRFKFLLKRNPKPSPTSESLGIGESESAEMKENSPSAEQPDQEPKNRFNPFIRGNHRPFYVSESKWKRVPEKSASTKLMENRFRFLIKRSLETPYSSERESTEMKENSSSPEMKENSSSPEMKENSSSSEMKENSSSIEQPLQESSKVVDVDPNPTLALRSSFTKYLEKNPENEWLATGAALKPCCLCSSDKASPVDNNPKVVLNPEIYQWLH